MAKMYGNGTKSRLWFVGRMALAVLALLLLPASGFAQLEIGDNLKMSMNGDVGYGYSGSFGNVASSAHNHGFVSSADVNGYYFHPDFLSFSLHPFFDRSQSNADSQTLTRGSGFNATTGIFSGSRFPGSLTFGKNFASNTEFRLAGVPSLAGDSSGTNFGVSWSAFVPNLPPLTATYAISSTDASTFGSDSTAHNASKNLTLTSSYQIAGFGLGANLSHVNSNFKTPSYLTFNTLSGDSSTTSYGATLSHALPMRGSFGLGWSHSATSTDRGDDWNTTNYTITNSFTPWHRISLYQNANYTTNLSAALAQSVLNGTYASSVKSDTSARGIFYSAGASYAVGSGVTIGGYYNHRWQRMMGRDYEDSQYGGNLNFNHSTRLFGLLYFGVGLVDTASKQGNNGAGITANVGMSKKFGHWETSADFNYAQAVMTLGTFQTTSNYSYGSSVRRRINEDTQFGGSIRASHSGMVTTEGNGNRSESMSGFLGWKKYTFSGLYSQSSGSAVLTNSGELRPTPVGGIFTEDIMLFDARSWSVSGSTRLLRRIDVSVGYSNFVSGVAQRNGSRTNNGDRYNIRTEYRLRKFSLLGGYNRSNQDVSTIVGGPRVVNSYYLSLSRWFNVF